MPQIVGEHLARHHAGVFAKALHLRPDLAAAQFFSAFGAKDRTRGGLLLLGIFEQLAAEFPRQQDHADFAFEGDFGLALPHGFHCDIADFADPDAGGPDGLHQQAQPLPAQTASRVQQALIIGFCQLPAGIPEQPPLDFQEFHPAVV